MRKKPCINKSFNIIIINDNNGEIRVGKFSCGFSLEIFDFGIKKKSRIFFSPRNTKKIHS